MPQQDMILAEGWDGYGAPAVPLTNVLSALWNGLTGEPGDPKATPIAAGAAFSPTQTLWTLEASCSAAGSAVLTLTGTRYDTGAVETVGTMALAPGQVLREVFDRSEYASQTWTSTGAGAVTARIV